MIEATKAEPAQAVRAVPGDGVIWNQRLGGWAFTTRVLARVVRVSDH